MSMIAEILDRLSGIAVIREKLSHTAKNVDKLSVWALDHEKRLTILETQQKQLPKRKKK